MNFNKIRTYILEDEFKLIFLDNKVNIVNYEEIDNFNENEIKVKYDKGLIIISGNNLVITKLLNNELLIEGKIKSIVNE